MAERRFADAAQHYGRLLRAFPSEPSLHANLGMALHLSAGDREAVIHLRKAASAMPSSFQAHFFLGASLTRLGEFPGAIEALRHATSLDPGHPFARALLGDALESVGNFSEALDAWRALRGLEPENPFAHAGLVRCYEELAARAAEELGRRDPESVYVLHLLAQSRLATGQFPSALYLFRKALDLAPDTRSVRESIAEIYERSGRSEWAAIERDRASALPRPNCWASRSPECEFSNGRYDAVAAASLKAPSEELFWAARANAKLAESSFAKLTALKESVDQLTLLADILASQRQFSKAASACQRALEIRKGDGALERQMAELLYLARRIEEARPMLERFMRSDPMDPRWPAMMGNLLMERQEYAKAASLLQAALALPGAPPGTRLDLGRAYLAIGKPEEAVKQLSAMVETDTDGSLHYQLAQAYQRMGMRDQAREALSTYRALEARNRRETKASAALEITPPE